MLGNTCIFTKTLSKYTWLFFSSRTSARKRMSSTLASPSTGGAAMATSTASVETAARGRECKKQPGRPGSCGRRGGDLWRCCVWSRALRARLWWRLRFGPDPLDKLPRALQLQHQSAVPGPAATRVGNLTGIILWWKNKLKKKKQTLIYFLFFRHSDSGQTSAANTGGQSRLFGPEEHRDDLG